MADGSAGTGIIDICAVHGDRDVWEAYLTGFAVAAPDYLDKFAEPLARRAGVDLEVYRWRLAADPHSAVHYLIDEGEGFDVSDEDYIAGLRADGIAHQVLHGFPWRGRSGVDANRSIVRLVATAPDLLTCWLGVSLRAPNEAASLIETALRDWNIGGVSISPFWEAVPASERALAPIFETAQRLSLPIWIHAGQNFNRSISLDISDVRNIDRVATAFPDLKILIGHGGWPWISDAVAIVQRHPNVYLELSSHSPRFMGRPGSGWEILLAQARGALRGRILFGTSAWVSRLGPADLAAQIDELGLPTEIATEWRYDNSARLLEGVRRTSTD